MQHEVIQVIGDAFLISSNWRMCRYVTRDKQPLRPGFYYVLWPSKSKVTSYDQYARCFGPFPRKILADKLKTSAIGLGVINLDSRTPHHDSNRLYSLETKKPLAVNYQLNYHVTKLSKRHLDELSKNIGEAMKMADRVRRLRSV